MLSLVDPRCPPDASARVGRRRERGYTALSRHRDEARFYVVSTGSGERVLADLAEEHDPLNERPEDLFGTSRAKTLPTDQLDAAERRAELEQVAADHQCLVAEERRAETLPQAIEQRCAWLEANAHHARALLRAEREAAAYRHLALRDEPADQVRSSDPLDRDAHGLGMTTHGPDSVPGPPAVDVDLDLDFGP